MRSTNRWRLEPVLLALIVASATVRFLNVGGGRAGARNAASSIGMALAWSEQRPTLSRHGGVAGRLVHRLENLQPLEAIKTASSSSSSSRSRTRFLSDGSVAFHQSELHRISDRVNEVLMMLDSTDRSASSNNVTRALYDLADARTSQQVARAGARLESVLLNSDGPLKVESRSLPSTGPGGAIPYPGEVLDLVCRAAALTGLVLLAVQLVEQMLVESQDPPPQFPSPATQEALLTTLRKLRRRSLLTAVMEKLLHRAEVLQRKDSSQPLISALTWNIFLAALCEPILTKGRVRAVTISLKEESLDRAATYLQIPRQCVRPNEVSFATVLQACAKVGNHRLAHELWSAMRQQGVAPNAVAYNAKLELASKLDSSVRDEVTLKVWNDMLADIRVQPDRYSINLVLLPLVRTDRDAELESLLDQFVGSNSQSLVSLAFTAFLSTLVQEGELPWARKLLDTYIVPSLSPVLSGNAGTLRLVRPETRHFNIVLAGYQRLLERNVDPQNRRHRLGQSPLQPVTAFSHQDAWELFRIMQASQDCRPNVYTVTILSSLCQASQDLSDFLTEIMQTTKIPVEGAVLRAAITTYGRVGDASSACWLYATCGGRVNDTRLWNTLLGAMCNAHSRNPDAHLDLESCSASKALPVGNSALTSQALYQAVGGKTCAKALMHFLEMARDSHKLLPVLDSQSYCLIACALQQSPATADFALSMFRNATRDGVPADGRFVNSVLRCFGNDIDAAVLAWKSDIRPSCLLHENRQRRTSASDERVKRKHLLPAYHGLLYVTGRAMRPQMALRLVYAMKREGLDPDETGLNCYYSGKRDQLQLRGKEESHELASRFQAMMKLYESLLYVECTKYDKNDKRRSGEQRVRIIV